MSALKFKQVKFVLIIAAASAALWASACVQTVRVRDLIDLPPPSQVQAVRRQDHITVAWQAPAAGRLKSNGYLLYYAPRSLTATAFASLPPPVELAPQLSQFTFASTDSSPVFIHMRTRAGRQNVSLPSLPEVVVPGARAGDLP